MNPIVTNESYDTGDGGTITLTVTFGDGQLGSCTIRLNGKVVADGEERVRAKLGRAAELRGGKVRVLGTINRTSPSPRCSVTYRFEGGVPPHTFGGEANFDVDGEPVDVKGTFLLR